MISALRLAFYPTIFGGSTILYAKKHKNENNNRSNFTKDNERNEVMHPKGDDFSGLQATNILNLYNTCNIPSPN